MIMRINHNKTAAFRLSNAEEKTRVCFLVNKHVVRCRRTDPVAHHLGRTVIVIKNGIEQHVPVRRPGHIALCIGQDISKDLCRCKVADCDFAIFRPVPVNRHGEQAVIRCMRCTADGKESLALGLTIAIQQNLFIRIVHVCSRAAAQDGVLATGHEAAVIGPITIR